MYRINNTIHELIKGGALPKICARWNLVYSQLANFNFDYISLGLLTAAMYFLAGLPFVRLVRLAEKRFSLDKRSPAMDSDFNAVEFGDDPGKQRRTANLSSSSKEFLAGAARINRSAGADHPRRSHSGFDRVRFRHGQDTTQWPGAVLGHEK